MPIFKPGRSFTLLCIFSCLSCSLLLCTGCGTSGAANTESKQPPTTSVNSKNPWSPVFHDLNNREHRPLADESTKAIALIFILQDCPIANSYIPELNRLHDEFANQGIFLALVHGDSEITADEAKDHAARYELKPTVLLDPNHEWVKKAGAKITPEAVVFSPDGNILYRGRIDDQYAAPGKRRAVVTSHDLRDALAAIVAGQRVSTPQTEAVGCHIPEIPDKR